MNSPTAVAWPDAQRREVFERWLAAIGPRHGLKPQTLAPASADASFRRYLRIGAQDGSLIIMDAPPPQEDVRPFVQVAQAIREAGLNGPPVLECDAEQGFLLLGDLGNELYLKALQQADAARADALMRDAIAALVQWQLKLPSAPLPTYDEALLARELALFPEWCVQREFGLQWGEAEHARWQSVCRLLIDSALAQPVVAVHRDWMPRNLMVATPNPGILDFQDAVRGPLTYDLVSLLRDCYISWPQQQVHRWALEYRRRAGVAGLDTGSDEDEFLRWFDLMGVQRHLKAAGIFARLWHRDGKTGYLPDVPRTLGYVIDACDRHPDLAPLGRQVRETVLPAVLASLETHPR